ncbi:pyridoxamine 5'-phosphate oxidase family protein [Streptomyces zaomyceticus]|uniref:pyridoxamine 5'-phosphate oxidase family protein n=1 Tax=Streptomyces zaomyceticus TaxID=68286 RepID=UPI002E0DF8B6|nr:pyridoxamine 5'-phosphate oxidase family protein [Streptomyces zaomyceticus]
MSGRARTPAQAPESAPAPGSEPAGVSVHELVAARSGPPLDRVRNKLSPVLHPWLRQFIALSPYVVLATSDRHGNCDASPRGGPPGFVRVVDERTLFVPEESGNRLHQTLRNLRESRGIGLLFLLPGMPETARVNGTAEPMASTDPRWTELALGDTEPEPGAGIGTETGVGTDPAARPGPGGFRWGTLVHVAEAYYHCGRSSRFAGLWDTTAIARNQADPPLPKRPAQGPPQRPQSPR